MLINFPLDWRVSHSRTAVFLVNTTLLREFLWYGTTDGDCLYEKLSFTVSLITPSGPLVFIFYWVGYWLHMLFHDALFNYPGYIHITILIRPTSLTRYYFSTLWQHKILLYLRLYIFGLTLFNWLSSITLTFINSIIYRGNIILIFFYFSAADIFRYTPRA